jgi:hypothetical protein
MVCGRVLRLTFAYSLMQDRAVRPSPAQLLHFCGDGFRIATESDVVTSNFDSDSGGFESLRDLAAPTPG